MKDLDTLDRMVRAWAASLPGLPKPEMVREQIRKIRDAMYPAIDDDQCEELALEFERTVGVTMTIGDEVDWKSNQEDD